MPELDKNPFPEAERPSPAKAGKGLNAKGPGGIPVWGYGVGLAGIVVVYLYYKNSKSQSATAAAANQQGSGTGQGTPGAGQYGTEQTTVTGEGGTWYPPWRGWIGGGNGGFTGFVQTPSTNEQWGQLVTDWLVSKAENPGDVADTVNDYLDGQQLDTSERSMIDLAVNIWGQPPDVPKPSVTGGGDPDRKRHRRKPDPDTDPNPGGPRKRPLKDPSPNPGGPAAHTREQTVTDGGQVAGTGKTVVIVE